MRDSGMNSEQLRLFIGIPLSQNVREKLIEITESLRQDINGVRWVPSQNWHVTIKFLGNAKVDLVPDIMDVVNSVSVFLPFELGIGEIGAFSSLASARVVWVGAYDESGTIHKIYNKIENGVKMLGFPGEKRVYNPHITIGRSKKQAVSISDEAVEGFKCKFSLPVNQVVLYKSELKRSGAEYSVLGSACGACRDST